MIRYWHPVVRVLDESNFIVEVAGTDGVLELAELLAPDGRIDLAITGSTHHRVRKAKTIGKFSDYSIAIRQAIRAADELNGAIE